ncbi:MAG: CaiB/BaiF CoA-transferase family protein [Ktedonobacterales bacterium]
MTNNTFSADDRPLNGIQIVSLALNIPGPVAASRLRELGATVRKIEPPAGDALAAASPAWYRELHAGMEVARLDLKVPQQRAQLDQQLAAVDVLLTAQRPTALERLGLGWKRIHTQFPRLCHVALVGEGGARSDAPGHDLTYQAHVGLLRPPQLPNTLLADLGAAEALVSATLALLLARERGHGVGYREVALVEVARTFSPTLRYGLTVPDGPLGGGSPNYNLYQTRQGWVALAALEPHFWSAIERACGRQSPTYADLQAFFTSRTAQEWEAWAAEHNVPLAAVREVEDASW